MTTDDHGSPPCPSPRLALLASILRISTHRSYGCTHFHAVYRGSLRSLHAHLGREGVTHDWRDTPGDPSGPSIAIPGLRVGDGGGMGGVLIEECIGWDGRPSGWLYDPITAMPAEPPTTPATPPTPCKPPPARSKSEARRLAVQCGSGDPADWRAWAAIGLIAGLDAGELDDVS